MRLLSRLARLEVAMQPVRERNLARTTQWCQAFADFEARRKSGVEISAEEQQRFARAYELIEIAKARRDKALGIRRKSKVESGERVPGGSGSPGREPSTES
jgi:hypothetical protein